jgi:predicted ATPase
LPVSAQNHPVEALSRYGAVRLFVDRAAEINPDFELTRDNAAEVVEVCRRVDGLPLAIELAASWIRVLPPHSLRQRLDRRLTLLTDGARDLPARQQTLRATIAWSYDLLEPTEQVLFRRLSVFVGGFTLDAAEAIAGGGDPHEDVLDGVKSLAAKSLVRRQAGLNDHARLGMLETIREYGLEHLQATGEFGLMRSRHASFYLGLAEEAEPALLGAEQVRWARLLELEYDNLRAVMAWSREGNIDDELGLRLAGALAWFWVLSGVAWEARAWVDAMLTLPSAAARTRARARALHAGARVAIVQGDASAARRFAGESVAIFQALGDPAGTGRALSARAAAECIDEEYTVGRTLYEQSKRLALQVGDRPGLAVALGGLGNVMEHDGDY